MMCALLLSVGAVVFSSSSPVRVARQGSARLFAPMMRAAGGVGRAIESGARGISFSKCGTCDDEGNARNVAEAKLVLASAENESLKKTLGLKQQFGASLKSAAVILYNQEWDREWMIIDAGEEDGVRIGALVMDEHQFLVGEINEVNPHSATVSIVSNRGTAFGVALAGVGDEALAHGLGARAFGLELIPQGSGVAIGAMVMRMVKSDKRIPPIFAGRVVRLDDRAGGAFKTGVAVLLSHPERIERVIIINL